MNNVKEIIEVLKYRGFRIECKDDKYYLISKGFLSNYYRRDLSDIKFLNLYLEKLKIGVVDKKSKLITITDDSKINELKQELFNGYIGMFGGESLYISSDHRDFVTEIKYDLVPTYGLDPYIARYVNALRMCGMNTTDSCDGDHFGSSVMYVGFYNLLSELFNIFLWDNVLNDKFKLNWTRKYFEISIKNNKNEQYDELNKAAIFLEENSDTILKFKEEVVNIINKDINYLYNNEKETEKYFLSTLNQVFVKYKDKL